MKKHLLTSSCSGGGINRLRNNAFTLIELLAIIVILAIIAVITVPIILNIIENSRKGAATDSAYGYKDSVNKTYIAELQNHNKLKLEGTYTVNSDGSLTPADENTDFNEDDYDSLDVPVSGTIPSSGSLTYENNVLKSGYLVIGDYRVTFNQDGTVTTIKNTGSSSSEQESGRQNENNQVTEPLEIGDTVAYSTVLNNVTLDNWKVLYVDGNYTYIILADYLPIAAVDTDNISGLKTNEDRIYSVTGDGNRSYLLDAMTTTSNWDDLVTNGQINGTSINLSVGENVWAMGAPTLDLWVNSWNAQYPEDLIYTLYDANITKDEHNFEGWGVNNYPIEVAYSSVTAYLYNGDGWDNKLYCPRTETIEDCYGYWLASPSSFDYDQVVNVNCNNGEINYQFGDDWGSDEYAFRPVIKLPTSVVNQ